MKKTHEITGKHVLLGFVAFFGLIFVANAIFVFLALDSWTGLETRQHYNEGLAYNKILAADERQKSLGWRVNVTVEPISDGKARLVVSLQDESGQALSGIDVQSSFFRPTHEGHDFVVPLHAVGEGKYAADFDLPLAGQWDVRVAAHRGKDRYLMQDRVVLR